jgi:hypothetical protein
MTLLPDAARERVAGVFVEAPGLLVLGAVADTEPFQRDAHLRYRGVGEVLESAVVGNADVLAKLTLSEAHERAVDRLGAHRLGAQPGAELFARFGVGADANEVEADLDGLDGFEGGA